MGGKFSRDKGQRAEREVAGILNPIIARVCGEVGCDVPVVKRNLMQTQNGGYDLHGLDWLAVEIKHHENIQLNPWWDQTVKQARPDQEAVLLWKESRKGWRARMWTRLLIEKRSDGPSVWLRVPGNVSMEHWLMWFESRLRTELSGVVTSAGS